MPELPEVETVRKGLNQRVAGKTIAEVAVYWDKIIESPDRKQFCDWLKGQTIEQIKRRGKYLIFQLTDFEMISHLRMEGKYHFFRSDKEARRDKHTHVIFYFTDGSQLHYHDVRKFGRLTLVEKGLSDKYKGILQLGPEPLSEDFQLKDFEKKLKQSKMLIKPLLLNQKVVAGLGNIYADEVLWRAEIHPQQPASTLKKAEVKRLYEAIIQVLAGAVSVGGTTIRTYDALGQAGHFQVKLNAYGKTGAPCPRCKIPIEKIKVAQRGTHFCPHCQKLKRRKIR